LYGTAPVDKIGRGDFHIHIFIIRVPVVERGGGGRGRSLTSVESTAVGAAVAAAVLLLLAASICCADTPAAGCKL
jgi:hypothetical protein